MNGGREKFNVSIPLKKGDTIAVFTANPSILKYIESEESSFMMPAGMPSIKRIPALNLITTVPFEMSLPSPTPPDSSGEFVYTVDVVNPVTKSNGEDPVKVTKRLKYQVSFFLFVFP